MKPWYVKLCEPLHEYGQQKTEKAESKRSKPKTQEAKKWMKSKPKLCENI